MKKINSWECLTSDMVAQDRKERRANYTRGFNDGKKEPLKLKSVEKLTFPTMFDGLYLGAVLTGVELIIVLFSWLINFFLCWCFVGLESYLIALLFVSNICFVIFLKHNNIFSYSVWKEITTKKGK